MIAYRKVEQGAPPLRIEELIDEWDEKRPIRWVVIDDERQSFSGPYSTREMAEDVMRRMR